MATKTEVVPASETALVAYDSNLFPELKEQDPRDVMRRFAERFEQAQSLDELFDVLQGTLSKHLVGKTLEILGVDWAAYMSDLGIIPNAICKAIDMDTGELIQFATTSAALTMFIRKAQIIDAIPFKARITETRTRSGQTALNFARP